MYVPRALILSALPIPFLSFFFCCFALGPDGASGSCQPRKWMHAKYRDVYICMATAFRPGVITMCGAPNIEIAGVFFLLGAGDGILFCGPGLCIGVEGGVERWGFVFLLREYRV